MDHLAGRDPRAEFGPDGLERAVAEVGAVLNVRRRRRGDHHRRRTLGTGWCSPGQALAVGRIDLAGFLLICNRTKLVVDPDLVKVLDTHIAQAVVRPATVVPGPVIAMVDAIVAMVDPDALLRRKERAAADRDVTIRPDRFQPGASRISASLPMIDAPPSTPASPRWRSRSIR